MCGFTSIISNKGKFDFHNQFIRKMNEKIDHRGPDSDGYWNSHDGKVLFGHKRLSIVDLSNKGHQPMNSINKNLTIIYNGEIYNHLEIRNKYFKNHKFKSHCDTETLVESIELLGVKNTLKIIDGMFSFAVYNRRENLIYLARDRMGEKPLYYTKINSINDNFFLISSELKSFSEHIDFKKKLNKKAINLFLKYKYIPSPMTIFENVFKLNPGTFAKINLNDMNIKKYEYWNIKNEVKSSIKYSLKNPINNYKHELKKTLSNSIKKQLLGDVEIGSFLSAGIDSSLVTSIMSENSQKTVNTFSVGFNNKDFDESGKAKEISNILGTNHNELILNSNDILKTIPYISDIYDEPFSDSSQIPTYLISKFASKKVKVCLSGDGGDELFGGYNRYLFAKKYWNFLYSTPKKIRNFTSKIIGNIKPQNYDYLFNMFPKNKYDFYGDKIHKISKTINFNTFIEFNEIILSDLVNNHNILLNNENGTLDLFDLDKDINEVEILMLNDLKYYLPDDILVKVDRAAMNNSLETRMPYLNKDVINLAWQIPLDQKIHNDNSKFILKEILSDYLPQNLIEKKKKGFALPLANWLRNDLHDWVSDSLDKNLITQTEIFNYNEVMKIWDEHKSNKKNNHSLLWSILTLQNWLQTIR